LTGKNELRTLTRPSFRFGANLATVTVEAGSHVTLGEQAVALTLLPDL
jgi:hypothetical protein